MSPTVFVKPAPNDEWDSREIKQQLENQDENIKIDAMKRIIIATVNGMPNQDLIMPIFRFIMPSKNKALKKLLLLYFENMPKLDENGNLKQEAILVCNAIRNDLLHPNEYIRGATLRFVGSFKEPELIEPLVSSVRQCISHVHPYVRKNAILASWAIFKSLPNNFTDAPELLAELLDKESDKICIRNLLAALTELNPRRVAEYIVSIEDIIIDLDAIIQLQLIKFIRAHSSEYSDINYDCIKNLLMATDNAVKYSAATALVEEDEKYVADAAKALIELLIEEPCIKSKFLISKQIIDLQNQYPYCIVSHVPELLRFVNSVSSDELFSLVIAAIIPALNIQNVKDVVSFVEQSSEKIQSSLPAQLLFETCLKFPESVSDCAIGVLIQSLSKVSDLGMFKQIMTNSGIAKKIITQVISQISQNSFANLHSISFALELLGLFLGEKGDIERFLDALIGALKNGSSSQLAATSQKDRVLADGTYTTYVAQINVSNSKTLRDLLSDGHNGLDIFSSLCLAILRCASRVQGDTSIKAKSMYICTSIIRLAKNGIVKTNYLDFACFTLQRLLQGSLEEFKSIPVTDYAKKNTRKSQRAIDEAILFEGFIQDSSTSGKPIPARQETQHVSMNSTIIALTGHSDAVFAEAEVSLSHSDIFIDILLINVTEEVMQNVQIELYTSGDMSIADAVAPQTLMPFNPVFVKTSVKVNSISAGKVFGYLAFNSSRPSIMLSDIKIDIFDFFMSKLDDILAGEAFRKKWITLEWENKVPIGSSDDDIEQIIDNVCTTTKLIRVDQSDNRGQFAAVNLYGRTFFGTQHKLIILVGDEVLANVSVSSEPSQKTTGHVRVRSRSQAIAVAFGDRLSSMLKSR